MKAALGAESAAGAGTPAFEVTQAVPSPATRFTALQPTGRAGGVTPSKFSVKVQAGVAVGVGLGVGLGLGVGVGPVQPSVETLIDHPLVMPPTSPPASSTIYKLQVPFGLVPLN